MARVGRPTNKEKQERQANQHVQLADPDFTPVKRRRGRPPKESSCTNERSVAYYPLCEIMNEKKYFLKKIAIFMY